MEKLKYYQILKAKYDAYGSVAKLVSIVLGIAIALITALLANADHILSLFN